MKFSHNYFFVVKILIILSFTILLPSCFSCEKIENKTKLKQLDIVFTSSVQGELEPCGCSKDQLGGLAKIATLVKKIKISNPGGFIFLDTGNLLLQNNKKYNDVDLCESQHLAYTLLRSLKTIDLQASSIVDDNQAASWIKQKLDQFNIDYFDSAKNKDDNYKVFTLANGIKLGIIAIKTDNKINLSNLKIKLIKTSKQLKNSGTNIIIAMSYLEGELLLDTIRGVEGINLLIDARAKSATPYTLPGNSNNQAATIYSGTHGQHLGHIKIVLKDNDKSRLLFDNRLATRQENIELLENKIDDLKNNLKDNAVGERAKFVQKQLLAKQTQLKKLQIKALPAPKPPYIMATTIPVTKNIKDDSTIQKYIDEYNKKIPNIAKECESDVQCIATENDAKFVGAENCKSCHQTAYEHWQKALKKDIKNDKSEHLIGHSIAWKTLQDRGKDTDPKCVGCHSVGFRQRGGYCKIDNVGAKKNVQCESCHGPGSKHAATANPKYIKRQVSEQHCRQCHKVPHIKNYQSFNYNEGLRLILGKGHGFELLKRVP